MARWSVENRTSGFRSTLSLIPIVKYSKTYQTLKDKYKDMVKVTWRKTFVIPLVSMGDTNQTLAG